MTYWTAILLGLIQGLAEFLPISSSGHLAILQNFLRIGDLENQMLFDVLLHLGTLGAVIFAYHTELRGLCREGLMLLHLQSPSAARGRTRQGGGCCCFSSRRRCRSSRRRS
ncbi:MAG: undecaprenyl-diphosphate phosphatase [Oscillospiraceae bacterium]